MDVFYLHLSDEEKRDRVYSLHVIECASKCNLAALFLVWMSIFNQRDEFARAVDLQQ